MGKRTINAKQIITDIKSGTDENSLLQKYDLTPRQFQTLLRKLVVSGYISSLEISDWLRLTQSEVFSAMNETDKAIQELD
jgi:DNA-binding MarR family transcriptional regulator